MINKNKTKLIIFDIDNTLAYGDKAKEFYVQYSRCLEKTLAKELKITVPEAKNIADSYRQKYNGHGEKSFDALGIGLDVWFEAILTLDPRDYLEKREYTAKLLNSLRQFGFIVGAITDGPRLQASRILKSISVDENLFDFIIGWEKGGNMPKYGSKKIYEDICQKYKINPEEVFMIGDSLETDILPAFEIGLDVIHVSDSGGGSYKQVSSIEELYKKIK